jgi:superfamily II DNA or RNA helicase
MMMILDEDTVFDKIAASIVGSSRHFRDGGVKTKELSGYPTLKEGVELTKSQTDFANFIQDRKGIGIAAWKPGAGKTLGTIASFLNLRAQGKAGKALVLVPASLRVNFAEGGVAKFTNATWGIVGNRQESATIQDMNIERMGDKDFYVISHDLFRANPDYYLQKTGADTVIMDEMHRVKDPKSVLNDVIEKVGPKVRNFIGATATPAMNKPFEAIELKNVISSPEERLGEKQFSKKFIKRAPKDFWERVQGWFGGKHTGEITGYRNKEELAEMLGKAFHFADPTVKGMPKKQVEVVEVPMSPDQEHDYGAVLKKKLTKRERKILEEGQLFPDTQIVKILNKVMAARQLSNNAKWITGDLAENAAAKSPKILRMLHDAEGHLVERKDAQIVIASNFIGSGAKLIEAILKKKGIPYATYYGKGQKGTTGETREQAVKDYRAGKVKVLLMSGAGAEGLDLPNTTMHLTMDPHYNPKRIQQQEARGIRRGGQKHIPEELRKVVVKRYISQPKKEFSIDSSIYQIAAKKKALVDGLTEIGLRSQQERAMSNPAHARALALFSTPKTLSKKITPAKPPKVKAPVQPDRKNKVQQIPQMPPQEEIRKAAAAKFAGNGGYLNARGSFDEHQVRLIGGRGGQASFDVDAGDTIDKKHHTQTRLGGKWGKKRKSTLTGKQKAKMTFTGKTEGNLGPNENSEPVARTGY